RPPNAFILYRRDHQQSLRATHKDMSLAALSKHISALWKAEDPMVKAQYFIKADKIKREM
ncbi:hypothetical protein DFJ73DRAFT_603420, partial [Zopfochytrium polystomum]